MFFLESKTHNGWTAPIHNDDTGLVTSYDIEPQPTDSGWRYKLHYTKHDLGPYQRYIGTFDSLELADQAAEEDHHG